MQRLISSLILAGLVLLAAPLAAAAPRLNVVMIVADDLGLQLGCYGERTIQTPHIDRLAAENVRFTHAFCTTASCSPSRSVILTVLYSHANGQFGLEHTYPHFRSHERRRGRHRDGGRPARDPAHAALRL